MMKHKLGTLALISLGQTFRSRLEREPDGKVNIIQMRDLTTENTVNTRGVVRINCRNIHDHHRLETGDIIFRARGQTNTAVYVGHDPGLTILAAPLFRLRVSVTTLLPEYLVWYLNQPLTQAYLASHQEGTAQKKISKEVLEQLDILVPARATQQRIAELAQLARREHLLSNRLADKREQYIQGVLVQMASETPV